MPAAPAIAAIATGRRSESSPSSIHPSNQRSAASRPVNPSVPTGSWCGTGHRSTARSSRRAVAGVRPASRSAWTACSSGPGSAPRSSASHDRTVSYCSSASAPAAQLQHHESPDPQGLPQRMPDRQLGQLGRQVDGAPGGEGPGRSAARTRIATRQPDLARHEAAPRRPAPRCAHRRAGGCPRWQRPADRPRRCRPPSTPAGRAASATGPLSGRCRRPTVASAPATRSEAGLDQARRRAACHCVKLPRAAPAPPRSRPITEVPGSSADTSRRRLSNHLLPIRCG